MKYTVICSYRILNLLAVLTGMFLSLSLAPAAMADHGSERICYDSASRTAGRVFDEEYERCLRGGGGGGHHGGDGPRCRSDWDCSPGESCIEDRCVIRPRCDYQIMCDECFLGRRSCRIIDCRGNLRSEFQEQCTARNTYACGGCQSANGVTGHYYEVFLENVVVERSATFANRAYCENSRATDPRCNGN